MKLEIDIPEHHYNNIIALDSVSLGRVPYKGIIMYAINAIKRGKALEQEPTTKNDLGVDCISRDDVRDVMQELWGTSGELMDRLMALPSVTPQEPKIKVLERDEAMRKLGAVDIYQARAWITLLDDLEYLKLKICEVEE